MDQAHIFPCSNKNSQNQSLRFPYFRIHEWFLLYCEGLFEKKILNSFFHWSEWEFRLMIEGPIPF